MLKLGVNIDHIATLREARYKNWQRGLPPEPNLLEAARLAEKAGAHAITVHLREDRRHIQDADVKALRKALRTPLNLEMAVTPAMTRHALLIKPQDVCLVPENRLEVTTEGGLNLLGEERRIKNVVTKLRKAKIWVSVFIDADLKQIEAAHRVGATFVELHTGCYANATTATARKKELARQSHAAALAHDLGLGVNAGHGLHYTNLAAYLENVPYLQTLNIGHAIVSRAIFVGLTDAIHEMLELMGPVHREPHAD